MRGTGDEAVVFHRESAVTKQMRRDRLARRVKNVDYKYKLQQKQNGQLLCLRNQCKVLI
jgi:hypothetical protein